MLWAKLATKKLVSQQLCACLANLDFFTLTDHLFPRDTHTLTSHAHKTTHFLRPGISREIRSNSLLVHTQPFTPRSRVAFVRLPPRPHHSKKGA